MLNCRYSCDAMWTKCFMDKSLIGVVSTIREYDSRGTKFSGLHRWSVRVIEPVKGVSRQSSHTEIRRQI